MKNPSRRWILGAIAMLAGGYLPSLPQNDFLDRQLQELSDRGCSYRFLDSGWIEVKGPLTGTTRRYWLDPLLNPKQPAVDGLPTLTLNLSALDTNLYAWKYDYVNNISVTGFEGYGLLSGDLNQNGRAEVYGLYREQFAPDGSTRIFELGQNGTWDLEYVYPFEARVIENIDDIDWNGLLEVFARSGDTVHVFEQSASTSYPIDLKCEYRLSYDGGIAIPNELYDIDNDGQKEMIYHGTEPPDSMGLIDERNYVARYDSGMNNFQQVWSIHLPLQDNFGTLNFALGDFDEDGNREFVTSAFRGNVYSVEHVTGDSFAVIWSDSLSNAGRVGSGDVDGNGKEEFFVGGTKPEPDGMFHMRINAFESTGNNSYEPFFAFDIYPVGYFSADLYQTADIDNDGQKELLISFKPGVVIIKGVKEHEYELFYYKYVTFADGLSAQDVDGDSIPELLVSEFLGEGQKVITQTKVYRLDSTIVNVIHPEQLSPPYFRLYQNYPNPFNGSTIIHYELMTNSHVRLTIFDLLGREVETLVNTEQTTGVHSVKWNGGPQNSSEAVASGIYIYTLTAGGNTASKKLVMVK